MPRVRLGMATEDLSDERTARDGPDIRIDTDVFATLSGDDRPKLESTPTIVRWLDSWRA